MRGSHPLACTCVGCEGRPVRNARPQWQFWKSPNIPTSYTQKPQSPLFQQRRNWFKPFSLRLPIRRNRRNYRGPGLVTRLLRHHLFLVAAGLSITLGSIAYYPLVIEKWPLGYTEIVRWAEPFIEIFGGSLVALAILRRSHWDRMRWAKTIAAVLVISGAATYTYHHLSETGKIDDWLERVTQGDSAPGLVQQQVPTLVNTLRSIDAYLVEDSGSLASGNYSINPIPGPATSENLNTIDSDQQATIKRVRIGRSILVGALDQPIVLTDNPSAKNPSWDQLAGFLKNDSTDSKVYNPASFVCADFAQMLHNNAESAGWRAAYVVIQLGPSADNPTAAGHALNAFKTTDRGLVFIESTGIQDSTGPANADKVVVVKVGKNYVPRSLFPEPGWSSAWGNMGRVLDIEAIQW